MIRVLELGYWLRLRVASIRAPAWLKQGEAAPTSNCLQLAGGQNQTTQPNCNCVRLGSPVQNGIALLDQARSEFLRRVRCDGLKWAFELPWVEDVRAFDT